MGEGEGKCFRILKGTFVTKDTGTGIVHCAPGFGEEDYQVCLANGLVTPGNVVMPIDDYVPFKDVISHYKGINFKEADPIIMKDLKEKGRLIS